jgi:hypothetical protein
LLTKYIGIVSASDGDLPFSPVLGMLIGATLTIIIVILLVIIRVRRSQSQPEVTIEQKVAGGPHHNTMSSTKPLLRSASPRDTDERDPDVIPAKYGKACFCNGKINLGIISSLNK